ncbi:MAG: T9SS type A sorting domain-containing protein [Chitinophagaceae bacterium]|nr:T9SS type A sorting domain-containing protein [Chitinophagaceae bacterium]
MKKPFFAILCLLFSVYFVDAQPSFNAQTQVTTYSGPFRYGVNLGWYDGSWDDFTTSNIAAGNPALNIPGIGATTLRPKVFEQFTETWGIGILNGRFQHFQSLGLAEHTLFVDLPVASSHADNTKYQGCTESSRLYANMYEPIWDDGANGTPVNDNNHYALYIYQLAQTYKNYVRFWEIINEPDQDWGMVGWKDQSYADSWWTNAPTACQLKNIYVPIYQYIRLMRISYEVIKSVDPSAYVTPGGIGYASFLDCLLRYTDNPADGSISALYPNYGGAYFDVLSFHSYPHLNMGSTNRNSDRANQIFVNTISDFETVLSNRGFNGITYPKKYLICTENNAPRKSIGGQWGGVAEQRNYIIKSFMSSYKKGLLQTQLYCLGDLEPYNTAVNSFSVMGMYQDLHNIGPLWNGGAYLQKITDGGVAYKTTSQLLNGYTYNPSLTSALNLPANVDGAVFRNNAGENMYVLWAKTTANNSEAATANFSIPPGAEGTPHLYKYEWNYSASGTVSDILKDNIALTGSPVFLKNNYNILSLPNDSTGNLDTRPVFEYTVFPNPVHDKATLKITTVKRTEISMQLFDLSGKLLGDIISKRFLDSGVNQVNLLLPPQLSNGMYIYKIQAGYNSYPGKLFISR